MKSDLQVDMQLSRVMPVVRRVHAPATRVSRLGNGMRVASENYQLPTCTVGVWIDAGSRFETAANNGVAHYLEHMAFKGTQRRSQVGLEYEVENLGAQLNAYTSREHTVYYAKCMRQHLPRCLDILADILLHSSLGKREVERERSVILREMEEIAQNMQEVTFDILHEKAYEGSPLGRTILGPAENVRSLQREDLLDYITTHYKGPRMVLAAVGGVDHGLLCEQADKFFGHLPSDVPQHFMEPSVFTGGTQFLEHDMETVYGALAVEGAAWDSADNLPLMMVNSLIGTYARGRGTGTLAPSRLSERVSREGCETFQAFSSCYKDTGLFGVYFACSNDTAQDMVRLVQEEWRQFAEGLTDEELERGKRILKSNMFLVLDGTTPICEEIGRHMLNYGRRMPSEELEFRVDALTTDTVRRVLSKYTRHKRPVLAAVGTPGLFGPYETILERMRW